MSNISPFDSSGISWKHLLKFHLKCCWWTSPLSQRGGTIFLCMNCQVHLFFFTRLITWPYSVVIQHLKSVKEDPETNYMNPVVIHVNTERLILSLYWEENLPELQRHENYFWLRKKVQCPVIVSMKCSQQTTILYPLFIYSAFYVHDLFGYYYNQFFAYKKVNHFFAVQGYSFHLVGSVYL